MLIESLLYLAIMLIAEGIKAFCLLVIVLKVFRLVIILLYRLGYVVR